MKMQASYQASVTGFRGELPVPEGPLPAGRHSLTREVVLASQRGRLLDAMAQAVAEHGYGATTVAHVVAIAGVSRKTFYEHFSDKEDCFLALYDTGIAYVLRRLAEALRDETPESDPEARIAAGLRTFLAVLAEEPAFSRAIILEVHGAGAQALARRGAPQE
jgi:AcrR family transcriptional regulator